MWDQTDSREFFPEAGFEHMLALTQLNSRLSGLVKLSAWIKINNPCPSVKSVVKNSSRSHSYEEPPQSKVAMVFRETRANSIPAIKYWTLPDIVMSLTR